MPTFGTRSSYGLEHHGLTNLKAEYWNLYPGALVEQLVNRGEGRLAESGAVVVTTGKHTGRSPNDKFVVSYPGEADRDIPWCTSSQYLKPEQFDRLYQKMRAYLQGREVFVQDMQGGAHPSYAVPIRIISDKAWASLFARNLFIRLPTEKLATHVPEYTVLHCPDFQAVPEEDGTRSGTFIIIDFTKKMILVGGTSYCGEIKKSIFTVLNYVNPMRGVMSMHCSANVGESGDVALFFGLSGTGKTTLSSDPARLLIGDDEHGWSDEGIFNYEGGCYAKTIRLRPELEPLIWAAVHRFGTVLENVVMDPETREPDFDSETLTENTRAAYPLEYLPRFVQEGYAGHPQHIFFLTADAFGVLPPLSRLNKEQAMYYFLSGYTSKIAGTEKGLGKEPQATFSTCFGAPFLPLLSHVYAELLGKKIDRHDTQVWLVNTGWTGGPYGVGERIKLPYTRAMIKAVLNGELDDMPLRRDERFGLMIPEHCPGVPDEVLAPEKTWKDAAAYQQKAQELIARFEKNFAEYAGMVTPEVIASGPRLAYA